jgi:hypothetical protein
MSPIPNLRQRQKMVRQDLSAVAECLTYRP